MKKSEERIFFMLFNGINERRMLDGVISFNAINQLAVYKKRPVSVFKNRPPVFGCETYSSFSNFTTSWF